MHQFGEWMRPIPRNAPTLVFALVFLMMTVGCRANREKVIELPNRDRLIRDQLVFHTDFRLPKRHRLVEQLVQSRNRITKTLKLPQSDEPINVYLFEDEPSYRSFMKRHHPYLPRRRAFFVKQDTTLNVFAHWGDRVAEDLQHEVVHGYLHSVVPQIPLWLDEGLAEYYEVVKGQRGFNRPHILHLAQRFRKGKWKPDLKRLETLDDPATFTQEDYAEAWLWTHFLLESGEGERRHMICDQLARLRMKGEAQPMSDSLAQKVDDANDAIVKHLKFLVEEL